jgi:parallel beta-helix repeat protein
MKEFYTPGIFPKNVRVLFIMAILFLLLGFIKTAYAFNPPTSTIYVDDDFNSSTPGWGETAFNKIQDAVNFANPGDYIDVAAGNYTEQVTITKSLSLVGAGKASTCIYAPDVRPGTVTEGGVVWDFIVAVYTLTGSIDVRIEGFTIHGNYYLITPGADKLAGLFLRDVIGMSAGVFSCSIVGFASPTSYESHGLSAYNLTGLTIDNSNVYGGYNGIYLKNATGLTLTGDIIQNTTGTCMIMDNVSNSSLLDSYAEDPQGTANEGLLLKNGSTGNTIGSEGHPNHFTLHADGTGDLIGVHLDASLGTASNSFNYNLFSGGKKQIQVDAGATGITIIDNNSFGPILASDFASLSIFGGEVHLTNNFHQSKPRSILIDGATNVEIANDYFNYGHSDYAIKLLNASGTKNISENTFFGLVGTALICCAGADDLSFNCNTFLYGGADIGVLVESGCTGASITNNFFHYIANQCIKAYDELLTITGNNFESSSIGIETWAALTAHENIFWNLSSEAIIFHSNDDHDVTNNYWGGYAGPKAILNGFNVNSYYKDIVGWQGLTIQAYEFDNFDFVPWLQTNADADPDICGFQPDPEGEYYSFAPVFANSDGSNVETEQYPSIHAAVDQSELPYVKAKNGIFTEQVTIDRSVNVMGDNKTSILIPYSARTGIVTEGTTDFDYMMAAYPAVEGTIDVKIDGFTFNHKSQNKLPGTDMLAAIIFRDVAGVNSGLYNSTYAEFPESPVLENIGVKSFGNSDVNIDHNIFPGFAGDYAAVCITGGDADVTYNNFYYYNVRGIEINGAANFSISHNNFNRMDLESINLVSASGTQRNISDNYFLNESYALIPTSGIGIKCWPGADDVTINCNQIYYMNTGILIQDECAGTVITNNNIQHSFLAAINAYEDLIDVTGNAINYNYNGIEAWKALTAHENLIYYNTNYSIELHSNDDHDVSNNVYGGYNGPTVMLNGSNINSYYQPQSGDIIQCNSFSNIKFAPWLQSWDDTDPDACGWQPNLAFSFAPVYANNDGSDTETEQYGSIQTAVDQSELPYVIAKPGNFTEQVSVTRTVNLIGASGNSIIYPPLTRSRSISDDTDTWDYLLAADGGEGTIDFRMQGFSFNADEQNNKAGTDYFAAALFRNVAGDNAGIYNCTISGFPFTALPESFGVKVCGNSDLTVDHNLIYSHTGDGINASGGLSGLPNADISYNQVVDWHETPHCHNGIIFGTGVTGNIAFNSIGNHTRPGAIGISVATDGLLIDNNSVGICVNGIKLTNSSGLNVTNNTIGDNTEYGIILDNVSNSFIQKNYIILNSTANMDAGIVLRESSTGNLIGGEGNANNIMLHSDTPASDLYGIYMPGSLGVGNNTISYNIFSRGMRQIQIDAGVTGTTTIDHNSFGWDAGLFADIVMNGGSAIITNNIFNPNTIRGIIIDGAVDVDINNNSFNYGSTEYAMKLLNASGTKNISENNFFGLTGTALIGCDGADDLVFNCNSFQFGGANIGVLIESGCTGANITNNFFDYMANQCIKAYEALNSVQGNRFVSSSIGIETWAALTAHYNLFGSLSTAAIIFHSNDAHDITNNYWGGYAGPIALLNGFNVNSYYKDIVGWQGLTIQANTFDNFDFVPWLQSNTDIDPVACGFQADLVSSFAPVYTNNDGSATEMEQYPSIQAAVDQSALSYVFAKTGEFDEKPVIDRSLVLTGLNFPVIEGGGGGGRVVTVTEDNVTVDGFEIRNSGTGSDDAGVGLLEVTGCIVKNSLIHHNMKGVYLFNSPGNLILDNNLYQNTVYGAELIGSGQSGVNGNVIFSNPDGIRIGFSSTNDNTNYNINDNSLSENTNFGLITEAGVSTVNAECNWWGADDAAQIALKINGTADFMPWIISGYDPDPAPGFQPNVPCIECELLTLSETHVDLDCPLSPTGSIDLTIINGTEPYTCSWNGPGGYYSESQDIYNLYTGDYMVTVNDYNGCTVTLTVNIGLTDQPAPVVPGIGSLNVSCPSEVVPVTPPDVTDHCGTPIEPEGPSTGGDFNGCEGTITYTWTYTDYQPKTSIWTFTYTVGPNTPIVITCPGVQDLGCNPPALPDCEAAKLLVSYSGGCGTVILDCSTTGPVLTNGIFSQVFTVTASDECTSDYCDVTYTWSICSNVGHIFPGVTACCNYIDPVGLYELENVCYKASNGQVTKATPGVFIYYTYITAPAASFTIKIIQTKGCPTFKWFDLHQGNQIKLYTIDCGIIYTTTPGYNGSTGVATLVVTGAVPDNEYVLSAKYSTKSIIGSMFGNCGSYPTVAYTFVTQTIVGVDPPVTVPDSEGNIDAVANCSDNTPLPPGCTKDEPFAPDPTSQDITLYSFPNPFNTSAKIQFSVPESGNVTLEVYNLMGARISTLYYGYAESYKVYNCDFSGEANLNLATYIIVIKTYSGTKYQRLMMLR